MFFFQDLYLSILMNLNAIIIDLEGKNNFGRNERLDTQHVLLYMLRSPVFLLQYFLPPVHRWFLDHLDRKIEFLAIYGSPSLFIGGLNQNVK